MSEKYIKSKLFDSIQYKERREIEDVDKGTSVLINEFTLFDKAVELTVGKRKYKGTGDKMVAYFPIYLVSGDKVRAQLGVFELLPKYELDPAYMDEDNDLKLDDIDFLDEKGNLKLNLYSFVNKRFLNKYEKQEVEKGNELKDEPSSKEPSLKEPSSKDKSLIEDLEDDPTQLRIKSTDEIKQASPKSDIFEIDLSHPGQEPLKEETLEDVKKMKEDFVVSHDNSWIEKYMKNSNYRIVDVEANGNCFFAVIREAFARIGYKTSVEKLREVVADNVGEDQLLNYQEMYMGFIGALADLENKMRDNVASNKEYKKRITKSKHKLEKEAMLGGAKANTEKYKNAYEEKRILEGDLQKYRFMNGVISLEDFKEAIKKTSYWADEMAISILEKTLNVKFIILSEENFKAGDTNAVMKCISGYTSKGDAITNPQYYIIASHTGNHYRLITYKDAAIFKFTEIPYSLKILIVNKCIEKNAGAFHYIPQFRNFQSKLGVKPVSSVESESDYLKDYSELYDGDTVFQFYNKSADVAPGKGSGEKIPEKDIKEYIDLRKIKGWRRMLDDEYNTTFHLDNKRWATVEHYYQASKFKKTFPDFYELFSLDSKTPIDVEEAKILGSKSGKKGQTNKRPANIFIDPKFYDGQHKLARKAAVMAKFEQNENLRRVLLNTKKAKLAYYESGKEAEPDPILMEVRATLLLPSSSP
jgi:predicted NAD-dependent protein-ADP-ribosyltransferase YbiA (DUF1768 family)